MTQLRTSCLFSLRSSFFHFYDLPVILIPNSTQISGFFFKKNSVVRYDLLNNFHPEHPAFCPSEHHVCFLYVGKSKRTSSRTNRNEKLVRFVSFPIIHPIYPGDSIRHRIRWDAIQNRSESYRNLPKIR